MLNLLFGPKKKTLFLDDPEGWEPYLCARKTQAGVYVNEDTALNYAAVWCATRIIAETAASLPLFLYQRGSNDDREHASVHRLYDILHTSPNPTMGSMAFREGRTAHQVNWGNGFAEIEREADDLRAPLAALWPIHPSRVRPPRADERDRRGNLIADEFPYIVRNPDNTEVAMRAEEMLHIPGVLSEDGIWGKGVITHARETIGLGQATERHGANRFGSGNIPSVVIHAPGLKDKEARKNFREEWQTVHGTPGGSKLAILPVESKLDTVGFSNEDDQFLQTRVHNKREIATWYRIPAHMLGDLEKAGYNSLEHLSLEFIIYSLFPWLRRWEEQINLKLLTPDERRTYYAEHQLASLLRGDLATRYDAYQKAIDTGWLSVNEARRFENLNGIGPKGDLYRVPLNMTTADAMLKQPAPEDTDGEGVATGSPGATASGTIAPVASDSEAAAVGNIQGTALNGAQIAGLIAIAEKQVDKRLSKEAARSMIAASFPLMDPKLIDKIVSEIEEFQAKEKPAPAPFGQQPSTPPTPPTDEGVEEEDGEQPAEGLRAAVRSVLADTLRRMLTKEANEVRRHASDPEFPKWLDGYHEQHAKTLRLALGPTAAVIFAMGVPVKPDDLASRTLENSRLALLSAYESTTRAAFNQLLNEWPARADALADELLKVPHHV